MMVRLNYEESAAIICILGTVAADAKRIEAADPAGWATHLETINSLVADFVYDYDQIETLEGKEAAALRFLVTSIEFKGATEPWECAGMVRLRAKLGPIGKRRR